MADNGNKKKRVARIGNISSGDGGATLHCDDGLVQADCNLVYNIMESMNVSKNVMSFQQLQESRTKEKSTSRKNNPDQNPSNKQNAKTSKSKQLKKFVREKKFPLMAKCQKSMKYLKKNRCIPKPRAHVGYISRPSENSISIPKSNDLYNSRSVSNDTVGGKDCFMRIKRNSKKGRCSPEMNDRIKRAKISPSVDNSCDINPAQTELSEKEPMFISDAETDSDNEFERFVQKHQPDKEAIIKRKKIKKTKRRKRSKVFMCVKTMSKVTSKTLSDFEESTACEDETLIKDNSENNNVDKDFSRFRRIIEYNSDGTASDTHVNDTGMLNYDSSSSSGEENVINKSLNLENTAIFEDAEKLKTFPPELSSVISLPIPLSKPKITLGYDVLKLKCKIPCYVSIKRDPWLDKKAASLHADSASVTNITPIVNIYDDDDCIIIETLIGKRNSGNGMHQSIGNRNSNQGESRSVSEALTNVNDVENRQLLSKELVLNSNSIRTEAVKNRLVSNEKSHEICGEKSTSAEVQKEVISEDRELPNQTADLSNNKTDVTLNNDRARSATDDEVFNVQILSVKSLNESDVIVLSDENEEKNTRTVPTATETKENASEDSDVEIICLDSKVNKENCEKVKIVVNNEPPNKATGLKENSSTQPTDSIENDCIILEDLDSPSENTCSVKSVSEIQQSSQVYPINNENVNSNKNEKTAVNALGDSEKDSILKILGTIDFNCINKVLNETSPTDKSNVKSADNIATKAASFSCDNQTTEKTVDSFPKKLQITQNELCLSQKQANIAPIDPKSSVVIGEKHLKLVQNSEVVHNIKYGFENAPASVELDCLPSNNDCDKTSTVCVQSNTCPTSSNLYMSEKEVIASKPKIKLDILNHPQKNQQLLPVCCKAESFETPSDELDVIAAKSIQSLDEKEKTTMDPLLDLYRVEYKRFMDIKCTEQNVSAGLKLLKEKQAKKLLAISASIKNVAKKDACFHKITSEFRSNQKETKSFMKSDSVKKDDSLHESKKPSISSYTDVQNYDRMKIFNPSVVERMSNSLKLSGSSDSEEVYKRLRNCVCANCGELATFACHGCAKVYYCSVECGIADWNKSHCVICEMKISVPL